MTRPSTLIVLSLTGLMVLSACQPGPRPLEYGVDDCDHCRMTLVDERYGGEIVTRTGKIYRFDAVECLAAFLLDGSVSETDIRGRYVADYGRPGALIPVEEATFLQSTQLLSPMGANVTSFGRTQDARGARDVFGGELLSWTDAEEVLRHRLDGDSAAADNGGG